MNHDDAANGSDEPNIFTPDTLALYVYTHCLKYAFITALKILKDRNLADDAIQSALLKVVAHADSFDRTRDPCPWFTKIVVRICITMLRERRRQPRRTSNTIPDPVTQEDDAYGLFDADVKDCIGILSERDQQIVHLRFYETLDWAGVAETMNMTIGAVKMTFGRAKKQLKECIEQKKVA